MKQPRFPYKTPFGRFADDGKSFFVSRPDTPRPWLNILTTGTYGVVMSQSGSGYSWLNDPASNRLTRWEQDPVQDNWGRSIYVRDEQSGEFWSVGWKPVCAKPDLYECVHGTGYTLITSQNRQIQSQWMVFVPHEEPLEIWRLRIRNMSNKPRRLTVWTYLEWDLGLWSAKCPAAPGTALETSFQNDNKVILAQRRLAPGKNNADRRPWDLTAWHAVNLPTAAACGDREAFLGTYGSPQAPEAVRQGRYVGKTTHKWDEPIASLCLSIALKPNEERSILYSVGAAETRSEALVKAQLFQDFSQVDHAWHTTEIFLDKYLSAFPVQTPDKTFNILTNTWLKYEALSGGLLSRTGHHQSGGAFLFGKQLQNSLIFLPLDPERARDQIRIQASRQFTEGDSSPFLSNGDALWLPYAMIAYLKESGQWTMLAENVPFAARPDEARPAQGSLYEHACRAIDKFLTSLGSHGLPLLGGQETVWAGHFLYGVLTGWSELIERAIQQGALPDKEKVRARRYAVESKRLKTALNRHAWDGEWFLNAFTKSGEPVGSRKNKEGRIYLTPQAWAILCGVVDTPARQDALLKSLEKNLYSPHGPLFLNPPYTVPDGQAGKVARHSPATYENGGVEASAAALTLLMECRLGRAKTAWEIYKRLCPVIQSAADPKLHRSEPYAVPAYIDGPDSAVPGRAGWTWKSGSAAGLYRACTEGILGIQADWDGLNIQPCLPPEWDHASAIRVFRGGTYRIRFQRDPKLKPGTHRILLNAEKISGNLLPAMPGRSSEVLVSVGPALK
ncbi:MAG: hypothetical protein HY548_09170 [Elusimicrobia bacterium]|nr:hypothetical protein [Elusimicrobiota bacterium]